MKKLRFKVQLLNQDFKISNDLINCLNMEDFGRACNLLEEKGFMIRRVTKLKTK